VAPKSLTSEWEYCRSIELEMPVLSIGIALEHEKKAHFVAETTQNAQKKPWVSMKEKSKEWGKSNSPSLNSRMT
jgi:hypothetical protein